MHNKKSKISINLFGIVLLIASVNCHSETVTESSVKEFFKASGQEAQMVEGMQMLAPMLKKMARNMPDDLYNQLIKTDDVVDSVLPIYRKYFSEEEMLELIAFYKTPIGRKYADLAGKIQREGMEIAARKAQMTVMNYQIQKGNFTVEPSK